MAYNQKQYQAEYYQRNKDKLNEYKKEYQANVVRKNTKSFHVQIEKDLMAEFEKKLTKDGITKADFLRKAITEYLKK